jgi:hypothetical protein
MQFMARNKQPRKQHPPLPLPRLITLIATQRKAQAKPKTAIKAHASQSQELDGTRHKFFAPKSKDQRKTHSTQNQCHDQKQKKLTSLATMKRRAKA